MLRKIIFATVFPALIPISVLFAQIPNSGFENWTNGNCVIYSYKTPNSWGTINSQTCILGQFVVEQTTDAHSGSYAIKLTTRTLAGRTAPGLAVTGTINTSLEITEGGFSYNSRPDMISGWFKHAPVNTDTASVSLVLWKRNGGVYEKIGEAEFESPSAASSYTKFLAPVTYFTSSTPDSAKIEILSSYESSGQAGSTFTVDDLQFVFCNGLAVTSSSTDVTTVGGADGTATATPSGGTPPYNYFWSLSAQATATIVNLAAGSYCVTVSDANGCTATTACVTVSEPDCSGFGVAVAAQDATTAGGSDGSVTANVTGSTGTISYLWDNAATGSSQTNIPAGIYCVSVTDDVGCTASACGTVSDPSCSGLSVTVTATDVTVVGGSDGTATANPTGGNGAYAYVWNDGASSTTNPIQNLPSGNYCVTVTDGANCQVFGCVDVNEPDCSGLSISASGTNPTTPGNNDGTASTTPAGGSLPYTYEWDNGATSQTITGLTEDEYCVTVTDNIGCSVSDCVTISDPDCSGFSVSVATTNESAQNAGDGSATANVTGGAPPVSFSWNNTGNAVTITGLAVGIYCVTVTDDNGCTVSACDTVGTSVGISLVKMGIEIFPNPAHTFISIQLQSSDAHVFTLYDLGGKLLKENFIQSQRTNIDITMLSEGVYLYSIKESASGKTGYGKLTVK